MEADAGHRRGGAVAEAEAGLWLDVGGAAEAGALNRRGKGGWAEEAGRAAAEADARHRRRQRPSSSYAVERAFDLDFGVANGEPCFAGLSEPSIVCVAKYSLCKEM